MSKRRGAGEGAIYQRADGLWACTVELGRDGTGRRKRKVVTARRKEDAVKKRDELKSTLAAGLPILDDRRTVADYLAWWLAEEVAGTVKPNTHQSYSNVVKLYITPHIGAVRLSKLAPEHVRRMLRTLEADGKSARTRSYARKVLARALKIGVQYGTVHRNAAALVDGPGVADAKLDDALSAGEARQVLAFVAGEFRPWVNPSRDRLAALARVALTLGLRKGELLALRWSDLELEGPAPQLHVRGTLSRQAGGLVVDAPKTKAAARTVPLIGGTADALRDHRRVQITERLAAGPAWTDSGHVFTTPLGTPIDPGNALHWWYGVTISAGIGRRRFHATRHTAATLLLEQEVPLEVVSAILGHAGLAITADVYAKVRQDAKRRALSKLGDVLAV